MQLARSTKTIARRWMKKTEEEGKTADTPILHGHICMVDIMAENDKKRFYWLKLKKDFFQRHDIRILESMPNGKDYVLFYLKLMCESTSHEGELRFSQYIPYSVEMLATITNTNVDVVKSAVAIFQDLHMMEILDDGTIFMNEVQKMIGSETGQTIRKRDAKATSGTTKKLSGEQFLLPNGESRFIDEKRYGGNGQKALDLALCKCEMCGSQEGLVIHHANGYSNDIEDLYVLCRECHGNAHSKNPKTLIHNRVVNFTTPLPHDYQTYTQEIEKEIDIELEKDIDIDDDKQLLSMIDTLNERNEEARLYDSATAFQIKEYIKKAYAITKVIPTLGRLNEIILKVADGGVFNEQGYIIECFRGETCVG